MGKQYIVSEERLLELLQAEDRLRCLESDGVDNWSWYMEGRSQYLREGAEIYGKILTDEDEDFGFEDLARLELADFKEY